MQVSHFGRMFALGSLGAWLLVSDQAGADDLKINQLEQDVRDLKQQLSQQSRRVDRLEGELSRLSGNSRRPVEVVSHVDESSSEAPRVWLKITNWDRVRTGMNEAEVLEALGPPTTVRKSGDGTRQTLFYALEIGTGSYLSGSVIIADQRVIEVSKPTLR